MFVEFKVVENYRSNFISENGVSLFKIADLNIHQTVNTSEICRQNTFNRLLLTIPETNVFRFSKIISAN